MIKARIRRVIQGADYSAQEPRLLSALCADEGMLQAYRDGKDLYVEIAAIALHLTYNECLEHFPKDTPIIKKDGLWVYATEQEILDKTYDKLADGETDVFKAGKERRNQAKKILLGIMYGRGETSIAEQLGCEVDEAREIKNSVYDAFPRIKEFERTSAAMVREHGYVTTLWGRKRRLPDYNLPNYSFYYVKDDKKTIIENMEVPADTINMHTEKLDKLFWRNKKSYIDAVLEKDQILIKDNGGKIADASRQIINSRVQGCLDGSTTIITKKFGEVQMKDYVDRTLLLWDGNEWTEGTILSSGKKTKCTIQLEDGTTIVCSPDHRFLVNEYSGKKQIWKKCSELSETDDIVMDGDSIL